MIYYHFANNKLAEKINLSNITTSNYAVRIDNIPNDTDS